MQMLGHSSAVPCRRLIPASNSRSLSVRTRFPPACRRIIVNKLDLSGKWQKDKTQSDMNAYDKMLAVLGITGIKRVAAVKLIIGLRIRHSAASPQFTVEYEVSRVKFLDSVEAFSLGQDTKMSRRDGQPGHQTGRLSEFDKGVQTTVTWGAPNPGLCLACKTHLQSCNQQRLRPPWACSGPHRDIYRTPVRHISH